MKYVSDRRSGECLLTPQALSNAPEHNLTTAFSFAAAYAGIIGAIPVTLTLLLTWLLPASQVT